VTAKIEVIRDFYVVQMFDKLQLVRLETEKNEFKCKIMNLKGSKM